MRAVDAGNDRPLRISILQGAFLPVPPVLGGAVGKQWFQLGRQFAAHGHQVAHLSRAFTGYPNSEFRDGVQYVRVRGFAASSSMVLLKLKDLIYTIRAVRAAPAGDIIVTNTFWAPILLRGRSKGHVYVDFSRMPKGQVRFYLRSSRIRTPSSAVATEVIRSCPRAAPLVRIIPNQLTFSRSVISTEAKEQRVLYAGRIHPEKGVRLLLEAFHRSTAAAAEGWKLDLVGPWEVEQGGGGRQFVAELKRQFPNPAVTWIGPVFEEQELNRYYQRASIFVYPSLAGRGETFGVAPLEAMAWGTVPIVSGLECFRDFVKSGENGITFDHRKASAVERLMDNLDRLITDDRFRGRLSERALDVWRTHGPGSVASEFLRDFENLVRPAPAQ